MVSYYSLLNKIEAFCSAHLQIKKYAGEFKEQMPNFCTLDEKYPVVFVVPNSNISYLNQNEFALDIYCVDIIQKDRQNINVILSDTQLILNDLYLYFSDGDDYTVDVMGNPSFTPLNNFDLDYVAGWMMTITFQVNGYCVEAIPIEPVTPVTNECLPASVKNSDSSYNVNVNSGSTLVLPDVYIEVHDENGNTISTGTYPSVQDLILLANCPDCLPATINIKKQGDGTITSLSLDCGSSTDYYVSDNDIFVNGTFITAIDATDPLDVILKDQLNNTIIPISVTHDGNQHHLNIQLPTIQGATLLKSGQTVSHRQHDDGDIEAGRATTFLKLQVNNPFGNTNRFTDELGGQTYTNKIAIDWSTFNGSTVLGYYLLIPAGNAVWNTIIDNASALSIGTFTTGWRAANVKEIENVLYYRQSINHGLDYYPFSIDTTGTVVLWSSTTDFSSTINAYYFITSTNFKGTVDKTVPAGKYLAVRTFNVSGTTLT